MSQFFSRKIRSEAEQPAASAVKSSHTHARISCIHPAAVRRSLLFVFALFLFLSIWRLLQSPPEFLLNEEQRFVRFTENIFRSEMSGNTLSLHYTLAHPDTYQITPSELSLGDSSAAARKKSNALLENYYNTMKQFDRSRLSSRRQLTYDIFLDYLETELSGAELYLYDEPLSPTLGVQAQLPILLAEYAFRTKGDIEDYLCLLTQIPDYFYSILSFEQSKADAGLFMSSDCADEVILQCQQFIHDAQNHYLISTFNDKIDEISNLTVDEKIGYKNRNQSILLGYVIPAYQSLISGLNAMAGNSKNELGLYYLPQGQQYYRYLVRSITGDSRSVEEIEEAIKVKITEDFSFIQKLLQTENSQIPSDSEAADTRQESTSSNPAALQNEPDSQSVALQYKSNGQSASTQYEAAGYAAASPSAMLEDLRQKITADFPLLPDVSCTVKYVHESLQEHLSPAFYLTPAIDNYSSNIIYINPSSDYSSLELYSTLAHEGYPGHLYQSVYFTSAKPDLLRCILDVGGYTEGWATYVELEYAYDFWNSTSAEVSLSRYNRSFTLGLASLLDIGIHYHGYSPADVEAFLEKLGFQAETARSLYSSILQSPANYLQYYVGYLNFCDLRSKQQEKLQNRFFLKEFHKTILETGPAPFSILAKQFQKSPLKEEET